MPKQPPTQIVSRLRRNAARVRGHANLLVGDEAERRLKELADEIDQQAAALGAGDTPSTEEATASKTEEQYAPSLVIAQTSDAGPTQEASHPTAETDELEQRIRERAYYLWEADGRRAGRDRHYWEQAELQIRLEPDAKAE